jgi:hypothetical protein
MKSYESRSKIVFLSGKPCLSANPISDNFYLLPSGFLSSPEDTKLDVLSLVPAHLVGFVKADNGLEEKILLSC